MCCREEDFKKGEGPCNNIWLPSDPCATCQLCMISLGDFLDTREGGWPLCVDIRKQIPGYWCKRCKTFSNLRQTLVLEHDK